MLVDRQRRRLAGDQIFELTTKLVRREACRRRKSCQLSWIVEIVSAQPNHVAPRNRVARRGDVDHPNACSAGLTIDYLIERHRYEMTTLHRDDRRVTACQQVFGRAVSEIAGVLHVVWDRIGASQLVSDVLGHDRRLESERSEPACYLRLENLADVD